MAELQFDKETQNGPQLAAGGEVYLYLPAEIRFAGAAQQSPALALSEAGSGPCTVFLELSSFQNSAYLALGHEFVCAALELQRDAASISDRG